MDLENKLKNLILNEGVAKVELNLLQLPPEILTHVATYLSFNKLKDFGLVNKKCQEIHQSTVDRRFTKCVDLRKLFYVNEEKLLERVQNLRYKSVNLSLCYYLSSWFITELISRDCVRELDLTECNCTPEVIEAVAKLNLASLNIFLSITWREFFVSKENKSVSVLNGLNKLEIYHRYRSIFMMSQVSLYVLPHCHQLQRLKLFTPSSLLYCYEAERVRVFQFPKLTPTPVPKLESLILDFHNDNDLSPHIKTFLEIILHKKKVPLTNIYLGKQTVRALFMGILNHELISFDNADTLCVSCGETVFNSEDPNCQMRSVASVSESMRKGTKYKKISIENSTLFDGFKYIDMCLNFDITSIKEVNLRRTEIEQGICNFICKMSNASHGITYLDITFANWSSTLKNNPDLSNSYLMNCLTKLTNLRTLCIAAAMLSYVIGKAEKGLKFSLYKVTQKCTMLRCLRIFDRSLEPECISQDVLSRIKYFKNLRELCLINFCTFGYNPFLLAEIVQSCSKLKRLHVDDVYNEAGWEEMLPHTKQIKHLFFEQTFQLTKTFVDNLSECTRLEKLFLKLDADEDVEMLKYFAQSLKKLSKLQFLSITNLNNLNLLKECFGSVNNEIKERSPRFFFYKLDDGRTPMVHHQFFYQ